jgi:sugar phosphate isomerase/epimerase
MRRWLGLIIGFLTAPFRNRSLKDIVKFAADNGFGGLEVATGVGHGHIDAAQVLKDKGRSVKRLLKGTGVQITALARYGNPLETDLQKRETFLSELRTVIDAAEVLEVPVVCTLSGFPMPGKTKMQTIEQDAPQVFAPLCEYAAKRGVKIALENWFATNLQGLHHFERLFEVVPHENFGLNFDPSHLVHQDIDYLAAVERFAPRIFHTHAKDTQIYEHKRRWLGNYEGGWWRYVVPGYGVIDWGRYIGTLRRVGYDGALSIEHEDAAFPVELGFLKGKAYLSQFV